MPALEYQVRFTRSAGFDASSPRQADGSAASGSNSDALLSSATVLSPGQYDSSIDAGFYRYASLGDRVWLDTDGDGQQNADESGIAGLAVRLIEGGADGVIGTGGDDTTATATTDADGHYRFTGLLSGVQYQVVFSKPGRHASFRRGQHQPRPRRARSLPGHRHREIRPRRIHGRNRQRWH